MLSGAAPVNLAERLEDQFGFFLAETAARIDDGKLEHDLVGLKLEAVGVDHLAPAKHLALVGEFDGVADNVEQHLADPHPVSLDPDRDIFFHDVIELEALCYRHGRYKLIYVLNQGACVEPLEAQLHHAGIYLG